MLLTLFLTSSAWKSGPVQSFVKIWQDQDLEWSSQVEEPWKTRLNWCQAVQCSFGQFSTVERLVSTSFSLNWLRTGWGLVLWLLTMYIIENLYYWAWYYNKVIPCSVLGEGWGESVCCHPLSLPHCVIIIRPSPLLSCGHFHLLLLLCHIVIGGRGWGGDMAVVGSGQCCCVRVILWLFSFVVIVMLHHNRWQRARGWHGSGW